MSVPSGTYKARFHFVLGSSGEEEAVFGFHVRNADGLTDATVDGLATHIADKWVANATPLKAFMASQTHLTEVAVYELDSAGHAARKAAVGFPTTGTGNWSGTASTSLPWECAPVVSLYGYPYGGFVTQGGRKRGRMYFPPFPAADITNQDGAINNTDVDTYQTAVQAFLEAVNDIPAGLTTQCRVVILSSVGGMNTDVQDVVMGSTLRSQRRRERSQAENHIKVGTLAP